MWKYVCIVLGVALATPGVILGGESLHPYSVSVIDRSIGTSTEPNQPKAVNEVPVSASAIAQTAPTAPQENFVPHLLIPSIDLNDPIIPMGLNSKGEMDVPDGNTKNVGWYKDGTKPGQIGTAVFDAHIFAAFPRLHEVRVGDSIYVTQKNAAPLHFIVTETEEYALSDLTSTMLFGSDGTARLNLITCAGTFQQSINTYDHRTVVYSKLVN